MPNDMILLRNTPTGNTAYFVNQSNVIAFWATLGWLPVDPSVPVDVFDPAFDVSVSSLIGLPGTQTGSTLNGKYLPRWGANTAYAQNDIVVSPAGQIVKATAAFTSGSTYNAANWTIVAGGGGGGSSSASDLTSGTLDPARIADGTLPTAKLSGRLTETQVPASTALFVVYNATSNTWPARGASTTPKMFVSDLSPNAPQPADAVAGDMWVAYAPPAT